MIEIERKEVMTTKYEYVPVKGICDGCGKEFVPRKYECYNDDKYYDYYRIVTSHQNWGNDSCESYEAKDFCCIDCAMKFIRDYWEDKRSYNPGRMTHEMQIKHKFMLEEY